MSQTFTLQHGLNINHNCRTNGVTPDKMRTKIECLPTLHMKGQIYIAIEASLNQYVYKKTHSKALKGKLRVPQTC